MRRLRSSRPKCCASSPSDSRGRCIWAMMGDVADYGEWKTGRRASGTVTSAVVFALWAGIALGGALAGWLFSSLRLRVRGAGADAARADRASCLTASVYAGAGFLCDGCLPVLLSHLARSESEDRQRAGRAAQGVCSASGHVILHAWSVALRLRPRRNHVHPVHDTDRQQLARCLYWLLPALRPRPRRPTS